MSGFWIRYILPLGIRIQCLKWWRIRIQYLKQIKEHYYQKLNKKYLYFVKHSSPYCTNWFVHWPIRLLSKLTFIFRRSTHCTVTYLICLVSLHQTFRGRHMSVTKNNNASEFYQVYWQGFHKSIVWKNKHFVYTVKTTLV